MKIEYSNRYNDVYVFKVDKRNNISVTGPFRWMRMGWPNNYTTAYQSYLEDTKKDVLTLEEFIKEIHSYDKDTFESSTIGKLYSRLVTSDMTRIDMIDPSGGPYLCVGMYLSLLGEEFSHLKIKEIKSLKSGFKLITE